MKIRIGIDIDGVIRSEHSRLFSILSEAFKDCDNIEVFIITSREASERSREETINELKELGVEYDHLIITDDKQKVVKENGIVLFIDNEDENFQGVGPEVCCLKIREEGNYCFRTYRWVADRRTVKLID